ncbi:CBS domain-containing protein [Halosegnis marinus]|uniref:CBS domain-containing protein n=1 Tax=Halosegnis marinus TaxID=3034023 RepID=A0ABD5ZM80_9EURY|nr:CBS domain-containing protein [Halosegnis sp. DT85]
MFGTQERVTVSELMTESPETVPAGAPVADVVEWLDERGYTAAPVERDEPPFLFVEREALADLPGEDDTAVYKHAERIELGHLLSPDLGFGGIVRRLEAEPFYFVGWHGEVVGVLTRSDLNHPAAHAFLYTRVGELEMRLRDLLDAESDWAGTLATIPSGDGTETEYDAVLAEYEELGDADLQLREIDYTTFWHLQKAVAADDGALAHLPWDDGDDAFGALDRMRELRNHVAHYGNVVHNMDASYLDSGRNIHDLAETYDELEATLDALREWQSEPDRPAGA